MKHQPLLNKFFLRGQHFLLQFLVTKFFTLVHHLNPIWKMNVNAYGSKDLHSLSKNAESRWDNSLVPSTNQLWNGLTLFIDTDWNLSSFFNNQLNRISTHHVSNNLRRSGPESGKGNLFVQQQSNLFIFWFSFSREKEVTFTVFVHNWMVKFPIFINFQCCPWSLVFWLAPWLSHLS